MKIKSAKKVATKKVATVKKAKCTECKCGTKKPAAKSVVFTVHCEKGREVFLSGDFNKWDPSGKKMTFKNGVYSTSVRLAPGTYQYKFVIDGTWCADPENAMSIPNDQGTFNSVIDVK